MPALVMRVTASLLRTILHDDQSRGSLINNPNLEDYSEYTNLFLFWMKFD